MSPKSETPRPLNFTARRAKKTEGGELQSEMTTRNRFQGPKYWCRLGGTSINEVHKIGTAYHTVKNKTPRQLDRRSTTLEFLKQVASIFFDTSSSFS